MRTVDLENWLKGRGVGEKIDRMRSSDFAPKRYTITPTPGYALDVEGALDRPTFQVLSHGANPDQAEELAHRMDRLVVPPPGFGPGGYDALYPAVLGPEGERYRVLAAGRVGGGPAPVSVNPANGHTTFSCNYWFTEER